MINPPSKPISTLDDSVSATGHHLREDAVNGVWMDERDLHAVETPAWLLVDQLGTGRPELVQDGGDIVHLVGDVMHAGPALGDEPPHRRVVAGRLEQLDAIAAD